MQRRTCRISGRSKVVLAVPGQVTRAVAADRWLRPNPLLKTITLVSVGNMHKLSAPAHELATKVLVPFPMCVAWQPASFA